MTRCLTCKTNVTNLSIIQVIKRHLASNYTGKVAFELSTYGSTPRWLNNILEDVITSEYFTGHKLGTEINGILNQDVQNLTFENESFDLITSNLVFEHVPEDIKGYAECLRVLRTGGALIFTVPLHKIESTQKIAYLDNSNLVFIGKPEYHDSRLSGVKSVPVFWHHSMYDIVDRVKSTGFSMVELVDVSIVDSQGTPTKVVYAIKK